MLIFQFKIFQEFKISFFKVNESRYNIQFDNAKTTMVDNDEDKTESTYLACRQIKTLNFASKFVYEHKDDSYSISFDPERIKSVNIFSQNYGAESYPGATICDLRYLVICTRTRTTTQVIGADKNSHKHQISLIVKMIWGYFSITLEIIFFSISYLHSFIPSWPFTSSPHCLAHL